MLQCASLDVHAILFILMLTKYLPFRALSDSHAAAALPLAQLATLTAHSQREPVTNTSIGSMQLVLPVSMNSAGSRGAAYGTSHSLLRAQGRVQEL